MHVILQAWGGPSSAFLQLVSVYFPVKRISTPPGQAWNIFIALLYLASVSGVVLTTSSVIGKLFVLYLTSFSEGPTTYAGVAVTQKLIVRPETLGGNYMIRDDFDWNQSSSAELQAVSTLWEVSSQLLRNTEPPSSRIANVPA